MIHCRLFSFNQALSHYFEIFDRILYKNILPKYGIKTVHFRCDGAGCFVSAEIKALIALWKEKTGVFEKTYKNNVPGKGKTPLDGHFGVMTQDLNLRVDEGECFNDAKELVDICMKYPLNFTEYHLLDINREKIAGRWKVSKTIEKLKLGRTYYLLTNEDGVVNGKCHSRHSKGIPLQALYSEEKKRTNVDILSMRVNELKEQLKRRSADTKGLKAELQNRLRLIIEVEECAAAAPATASEPASESAVSADALVSESTPVIASAYRHSSIDVSERTNSSFKRHGGSYANQIRLSTNGLQCSSHSFSDGDNSSAGGNDKPDYSREESDDSCSSKASGESDSDDDTDDDEVAKNKPASSKSKRNDGRPVFSDSLADEFDLREFILQSTFDFSDENMKDIKERSLHSKLGYRERIKIKNEQKVHSKNKKLMKKHESEVDTMKCSDLFCCGEVDAKTKNRCVAGPFVSENLLRRHQLNCEKDWEDHLYPQVDALTKLSLDAMSGKWALCLACGAMPNRDKAVSPPYQIQPCTPMTHDQRMTLAGVQPGCYRRDNEAWKKPRFYASAELNKDLEALFLEGESRSDDGKKKNASKYTAIEAVAVLKNMQEDGRRKYRIDGEHGNLPTEAFVKQRFSNRKNKGVKGLTKQKDIFQDMSVDDLKKCYVDAFQESANERSLRIKLLEADDLRKYGGHDEQFNLFSNKDLLMECQNRKIPYTVSKKALLIILRAYEMEKEQETRSSTKSYRRAMALADIHSE